MSSRTRLEVLGTVRVAGADPTAGTTVATHERALGLLTYLALAEPPGFHRRDKLLALFWPDLDNDRARHALRQTLHQLRRSLGPIIERRGDRELGIDWAVLECDGRAFREAVGSGDHGRAVDLYAGDLLDGFGIGNAPEFERWLEDTRTELRRQAVEAGIADARANAASGDAVAAGRLVGWVSRLAPYDETAARSAMTLLDQAGDRAAALEIYRRLEARLRQELEVEPSPETVALVESLKRPRPVPASIAGRIEPAARSTAVVVADPEPRRAAGFAGVALLAAVLVTIVAVAPRIAGNRNPSGNPPGRVLWVDDNPENNDVVISALRTRGVTVATAITTAEAIRLVGADRYDAVITDIGRYEEGEYVPGAGMDLLRRLRDLQPEVPALVCTSARSADAHRGEALSLGAREVFDDCAAVVAAVAGLLHRGDAGAN
ncbi:MAG: BTAD domain-containing putative transcriptional regulator [Gemmatimonadales bacterium]